MRTLELLKIQPTTKTMSIHAKITEEAEVLLRRQERKSKILSSIIACLAITLIASVLALFALPMMLIETPKYVVYSVPSDEPQDPDPKNVVIPKHRKPTSAPAQDRAMVIAADLPSPTAIPLPDVTVSEPSLRFGDDLDFGQGWADNAFIGGGGGGFGSTSSASGGLQGFLYDLKQDAQRKPRQYRAGVMDDFSQPLIRAQRSGFSQSELAKHFRSPVPLYLTRVAIPKISADRGPELFGAQDYVAPIGWFAHYHGTVIAPRNGEYRFVGLADDYLMVAINGTVRLHASLPNLRAAVSDGWEMPEQPGVYPAPETSRNSRPLIFGDWITLRAGEEIKIDIALGERPGGVMSAILFIEEKGVEYREASNGRPILPLFTTAPILPDEIDELKKEFRNYEIEFDYDKTPLFRARK